MDGGTQLLRIPGMGLVVKTTSDEVAEMLQEDGWELQCRYTAERTTGVSVLFRSEGPHMEQDEDEESPLARFVRNLRRSKEQA